MIHRAVQQFLYRLIGLLVFSSLAAAAQAQDTGRAIQVFVQQGQPDTLQFVDLLTGETTRVEVSGERYTLFGRAVMFYDPIANRVMLATPDGRVRNHPFIQPLVNSRRIDWLISGDGKQVAWTVTAAQPDGQLLTRTQIAGVDGSSPREALIDGPRAGVRALPVAFSPDYRILYMDYQPDGIGDVTPFQQYAGLFEVDLETGDTALLPGEPGCFCGAGLAFGWLLRLAVTNDLSGFDVIVTNLAAGTDDRIPALTLDGYTQAGGVLIAPDSTRAVYALAQVSNFGGANQSVRTVFALVDLVERTQTALTQPLANFVEPLGWSEDGTALIVTSADPNNDGTWKVDLADGRITRVASATYLGTLR